MKTHYILCLAILFPQLVLATSSSNQPAGNVQASSFGTVQATLDYCARINPGAAARYQEEAKLIVGGQFKNTNEYQDGYAKAQAALGKISEHDAKDACVGFLVPANTGTSNHSSGDRDDR